MYTRDSAGRITSESDNDTSDTYAYNAAGQITSTTQSTVGGPTVTLNYQYDSSGRRTQMAAFVDSSCDFVDDYVYDSLGRVVSVTEHGVDGGNAVAEKEVAFTYNAANQVVSIDRYQDGQLAVEGDYSYDSLGRLTGLVYHQGDNPLNSYAWTYQGLGVGGQESASLIPNPQSLISSSWLPSGGLMPVYDTTGIVSALTSGGLAGLDLLTSMTSIDGTANYSYDPTGQLTGVTYSSSNPQSPIPNPSPESYTYDANGNRTLANGSVYVTGLDNRLLSDGVYTYSYDAEGNRTAKFIDADRDGLLDAGDTDVTQYGWDNRNRLVEVTNRAAAGGPVTQAVDYLYDAENRWVGETIDSNGDGVTDHQIRFAYDGNQIVLQFEKAGDGSINGNNLSHRYLWQPNAVDQLLTDEQVTTAGQSGRVVLPLTDHLGTVRDLAVHDAERDMTIIANHRVYSPFGVLTRQTNAAVDCLFGFTGRPRDRATGVQNNLNRWYDPAVGRWISDDPIGFGGEDENEYQYVSNCVTSQCDPSGLQYRGPGGIEHPDAGPDAPPIAPPPPAVPPPAFRAPSKPSTVWTITTQTGETYSGYGSAELLAALKEIDRKKQLISSMILKGHGYDEGITEGFFSMDHLIIAQYDSSISRLAVPDVNGNAQDVKQILERITNNKTKIMLNACLAAETARSISIILPGVEVVGCSTPAFSIPHTYNAVGLIPYFSWHHYVNGKAIGECEDIFPTHGPIPGGRYGLH